MKNFHYLRLTLYSVIAASILLWLLIFLLDNAALDIGGYYDTCDHHHYHDNKVIPDETTRPTYYDKLKELLESTESSIANTFIMPPTNPSGDSDHSNLFISDILAKTPRINIFSSLTRDFDSVSSRLNDKIKNSTVLAPLNSAVSDLPRKPWEDPEDYERYGEVEAYKGSGGEERAHRNLQRFVEAHIVPESPWAEGEEVETVGGGKVKWVKEGDKIFIEPGHIEVDTLASQVSNGELWILKGVINYK